MKEEVIKAKRSISLRKNSSQELKVHIDQQNLKNVLLINGPFFITKNVTQSDLVVRPHDFYMIMNNGTKGVKIVYDQDVSNHEIIYNPYKYENSEKVNLESSYFLKKYAVPEGYIDVLAKWYSFKFTYIDFNLIFVRPEFGLSIQTHAYRNEFWEIIEGRPIIISDNKVHYFVEKGTMFKNPIKAYHSVINPNANIEEYVVLKERWSGKFDEKDINRVFNPNHQFSHLSARIINW